MEFDISRAYSALNADELQPGDKVLVADYANELLALVARHGPTDEGVICKVDPYNQNYRFLVDIYGSQSHYNFAYLLERAPKKKYRPYKDTYEMIAHFTSKHGLSLDVTNELPMIWLKNKQSGVASFVTRFFGDEGITVDRWDVNFSELLEGYTYLDNSPCGFEEVI